MILNSHTNVKKPQICRSHVATYTRVSESYTWVVHKSLSLRKSCKMCIYIFELNIWFTFINLTSRFFSTGDRAFQQCSLLIETSEKRLLTLKKKVIISFRLVICYFLTIVSMCNCGVATLITKNMLCIAQNGTVVKVWVFCECFKIKNENRLLAHTLISYIPSDSQNKSSFAYI